MKQQVTTSSNVGWLSLDSWSSTYSGAHWLVEKQLPKEQWETEPHHEPLSQMVLIASHHLVEIALFACVRSRLKSTPGKYPALETALAKVQPPLFNTVFTNWPVQILGTEFDLSVEPFKSVKALQLRRNATIHSESALTTLLMARSALYTSVEASREITRQFLGPTAFKYDAVLQKYPLSNQPWFSDVAFPPVLP